MSASSDSPADEPVSAPVVRTVTIPDGVALHARPAADLVRTAGRFPARVTLTVNGKQANAKSILEIMGLGATGGAALTISATGERAAEAVEAAAALVTGLT